MFDLSVIDKRVFVDRHVWDRKFEQSIIFVLFYAHQCCLCCLRPVHGCRICRNVFHTNTTLIVPVFGLRPNIMIRMFSLYKTNSLLYKRALNQFLKKSDFCFRTSSKRRDFSALSRFREWSHMRDSEEILNKLELKNVS